MSEEWEKRFEEESPLAFDGRKWAKAFIRAEKQATRAEVLAEVERVVDQMGGYISTKRAIINHINSMK